MIMNNIKCNQNLLDTKRRLLVEMVNLLKSALENHNEVARIIHFEAETLDNNTLNRLKNLRRGMELSITGSPAFSMINPKVTFLKCLKNNVFINHAKQFNYMVKFELQAAYLVIKGSEDDNHSPAGNERRPEDNSQEYETEIMEMAKDTINDMTLAIECEEYHYYGSLEWRKNLWDNIEYKGKQKATSETKIQTPKTAKTTTIDKRNNHQRTKVEKRNMATIPEEKTKKKRTNKPETHEGIKKLKRNSETQSSKADGLNYPTNANTKNSSEPGQSPITRGLSKSPQKAEGLAKQATGSRNMSILGDTSQIRVKDMLKKAKMSYPGLYKIATCRLCEYAGLHAHKNYHRHVKKFHAGLEVNKTIILRDLNKEEALDVLARWKPIADRNIATKGW